MTNSSTIVRTYETAAVVIDARGSRWSGYSPAEAAANVAAMAARGIAARVEVSTFEVVLDTPWLRANARPGIADRSA